MMLLFAILANIATWRPGGIAAIDCPSRLECPYHNPTLVTNDARLQALGDRVAASGALALNSRSDLVAHMEATRELAPREPGAEDLSALVLAVYLRTTPGNSLGAELRRGTIEIGEIRDRRTAALVLSLAATECLEPVRLGTGKVAVPDSSLRQAESLIAQAISWDPSEGYPEMVRAAIVMTQADQLLRNEKANSGLASACLRMSQSALSRAAVLAIEKREPVAAQLLAGAQTPEDSLALVAHGSIASLVEMSDSAKRVVSSEQFMMLCDNLLSLGTRALDAGAPNVCCNREAGTCAAVAWSDSLLSLDRERKASSHLRSTMRISALDHVLTRDVTKADVLVAVKTRLLDACDEVQRMDAERCRQYGDYLILKDRRLRDSAVRSDPDVRSALVRLANHCGLPFALYFRVWGGLL